MPDAKPALRVPLEKARRIFVAAQGFPPGPGKSIVQVLEETGFVRTLGGSDIYLALRARMPGMRREDLADDLGHGRSFTLDTDEELRKRAAQVLGM